MAKDDYDVIVYRILVYLYACLKRKIIFEDATFEAAVKKHTGSDQYLTDVLRLMQREGLISGLTFQKVWGSEYLLASDLREAEITPDGIHYLKENRAMRKAFEFLKGSKDTIVSLAALVLKNT